MAQVGGGSAAHAHAPRVLGELLVQHLQRRRREEFGESVNSGVVGVKLGVPEPVSPGRGLRCYVLADSLQGVEVW